MRMTQKHLINSLIDASVDYMTSKEIAGNIKKLSVMTRTPMGEIASYDCGYIYIKRRAAGEAPSNSEICVHKGDKNCYYVEHSFKNKNQEKTWANHIN